MNAMRPLGYMYKKVEPRTEWLNAPQVKDIFSLSGCVSEYFADYINFWKHNGYWLFDSPSAMRALAQKNSLSLDGMTLFYYEAYDLEFDDQKKVWRPFEPESSFGLNIEVPAKKVLEGFDITSFSVGTSPECSPLSCNSCAAHLDTNEHCLFRTFEEARKAIDEDRLGPCEPGPYRIVAVYSVDAPRKSGTTP